MDSPGQRVDIPGRLGRYGRLGWSTAGVLIGAALLVLAVGVLLPFVLPLLAMAVLGATLQPVVDRLRRRGVPAGVAALAGALAVPLLLLALGLVFGFTIAAQAPHWWHDLQEAGERLKHATGTDPIAALRRSPDWRKLVTGVGSVVASGVVVTGQIVVGVLIGGYLLFYAFRDGPRAFDALEGRLPLPQGLFRRLGETAAFQFRRYMYGTTVIAIMDAAVITLGATLLRLPLIGTIAMLTFVSAYVPYLGAWVSAAFVVLIALGSGGVPTAIWMLIIVLITQNILEGILRPAVFGRALGLHPVLVLAVTVLGAALGGILGVFLAPPIAAIGVQWNRAFRELRGGAGSAPQGAPGGPSGGTPGAPPGGGPIGSSDRGGGGPPGGTPGAPPGGGPIGLSDRGGGGPPGGAA